ncbi:MAG: HIT family protein [Clostridiales bacterium]|nr:HIT family protein [Clostridiales bacterium]
MCDICKTIENSLNGDNPYFVREMKTGIVVLGWNQHFYGYTIFMCKQHATELYELESDFQAEYLKEMVIVSKAVAKAFNPEKMNYECLGNGDTHLHFHLFPRKNRDLGAYGNNGKGPVWWLPQEIMWSDNNMPTKKELDRMKLKLNFELDKLF